eukprot:5983966-Prymnesium_polylepis.1
MLLRFGEDDGVVALEDDVCVVHEQCEDERARCALRVRQCHIEARREVVTHAVEHPRSECWVQAVLGNGVDVHLGSAVEAEDNALGLCSRARSHKAAIERPARGTRRHVMHTLDGDECSASGRRPPERGSACLSQHIRIRHRQRRQRQRRRRRPPLPHRVEQWPEWRSEWCTYPPLQTLAAPRPPICERMPKIHIHCAQRLCECPID